jgi:hypothetical protein
VKDLIFGPVFEPFQNRTLIIWKITILKPDRSLFGSSLYLAEINPYIPFLQNLLKTSNALIFITSFLFKILVQMFEKFQKFLKTFPFYDLFS